MYIKSIDLLNFRNYENLHLSFGEGTHIFYGDNAQGKSNLLEAIYLAIINHSFRGSKDSDMINFRKDEAHVTLEIDKNKVPYKIDFHIRKAKIKKKSKDIAVNNVPIRKYSEYLGLMNGVLFSPEELSIVKDGPEARRLFMDTELCILDKVYTANLIQYNKALDMRNRLLKDIPFSPSLLDTLDSWDENLILYGREIIRKRRAFIEELATFSDKKQEEITGGKENLHISYEPSSPEDEFSEKLRKARDNDLKNRTTSVGPHRDDISFKITEKDTGNVTEARTFGSQGQKRTAALALKLSEIDYVREKTGEIPILLLDDVLSELDSTRQQYLLKAMEGTQTFLTCTGVEDFVKKHFADAKVYKVKNGEITNE